MNPPKKLSPERLALLREIPDAEYYKRIHPKPWLGNELRETLSHISFVEAELKERLERSDIWMKFGNQQNERANRLEKELATARQSGDSEGYKRGVEDAAKEAKKSSDVAEGFGGGCDCEKHIRAKLEPCEHVWQELKSTPPAKKCRKCGELEGL